VLNEQVVTLANTTGVNYLIFWEADVRLIIYCRSNVMFSFIKRFFL